MRIGKTLPPAATPIGPNELLSGARGIFRGQKELERFRAELKQYFGAKHCFLVSSGKAALTLILWALKELSPDRDKVLIPAFTCYSVPSSVVRAGLAVRLCDLHPDSLDLDFEQLSVALSDAIHPRPASDQNKESIARLLAVVPTHLFGIPSDVPRLRKMLQDPGVTIVEDAAQAMGETWGGRRLGTLGDVGFFSLGRGKALSTVEGGVVLTNRDDIADVLRRRVGSLPPYGFGNLAVLVLKALGLALFLRPRLFWIPRSMPFLRLGQTLWEPDFPILQMSSFQAGLAKNWRERLDAMRVARKANVATLMKLVGDSEGREMCALPLPQSYGLLRFPIRVRSSDKRKELLRESVNRGAGIASAYPESINRLRELRGTVSKQAFPVADSCARELVTLPTHGLLTRDDIRTLHQLLDDVFAPRGLDVGEERSAPL